MCAYFPLVVMCVQSSLMVLYMCKFSFGGAMCDVYSNTELPFLMETLEALVSPSIQNYYVIFSCSLIQIFILPHSAPSWILS